MSTATTTKTVEKTRDVNLDDVVIETERTRGIIEEAADMVGCQPKNLFNLLRNQWPGTKDQAPLTDRELFQAVSLIARYGLDPLVKEIYCSRDKRGRIMVIVGIDGWIKILDRTEGYDGHETTVEFDDDGKLFSATTAIYSTIKSRPTRYVAYWSEYVKVGGFGQAHSALKFITSDGEFHCCLGVACEVLLVNGVKLAIRGDVGRRWGRICFDGHCGFLPETAVWTMKFRTENGTIRGHAIHHRGRRYFTLSSANDNGVPFSVIADFVEKHPEAVFTEEA